MRETEKKEEVKVLQCGVRRTSNWDRRQMSTRGAVLHQVLQIWEHISSSRDLLHRLSAANWAKLRAWASAQQVTHDRRVHYDRLTSASGLGCQVQWHTETEKHPFDLCDCDIRSTAGERGETWEAPVKIGSEVSSRVPFQCPFCVLVFL